MKVRLHAFERLSRANGPGWRAVVWFQGCTLGCPGCFNPATHDGAGGFEEETATLADAMLSLTGTIEGISISGGEPFQQPAGLLDLLKRIHGSPLSRLVFSGYTLDEIQDLPWGREILRDVDVLIAGRYVASERAGHGLIGSANQVIHLLTDRYRRDELRSVPRREVILHRDGSVTLSGIQPWRWRG